MEEQQEQQKMQVGNDTYTDQPQPINTENTDKKHLRYAKILAVLVVFVLVLAGAYYLWSNYGEDKSLTDTNIEKQLSDEQKLVLDSVGGSTTVINGPGVRSGILVFGEEEVLADNGLFRGWTDDNTFIFDEIFEKENSYVGYETGGTYEYSFETRQAKPIDEEIDEETEGYETRVFENEWVDSPDKKHAFFYNTDERSESFGLLRMRNNLKENAVNIGHFLYDPNDNPDKEKFVDIIWSTDSSHIVLTTWRKVYTLPLNGRSEDDMVLIAHSSHGVVLESASGVATPSWISDSNFLSISGFSGTSVVNTVSGKTVYKERVNVTEDNPYRREFLSSIADVTEDYKIIESNHDLKAISVHDLSTGKRSNYIFSGGAGNLSEYELMPYVSNDGRFMLVRIKHPSSFDGNVYAIDLRTDEFSIYGEEAFEGIPRRIIWSPDDSRVLYSKYGKCIGGNCEDFYVEDDKLYSRTVSAR